MRTEISVLLGVIGVVATSMIVFRVTVGGQVRTAEVARRGPFVFGDWIREWFYWLVAPVGRASARNGIPPAVFNMIGLGLGLASGVAYGRDALPLGGTLLLLSGMTDVFDGLVARARGVVTAWGAFLDSTLDRFTEVAVFAGLAARYREPLPVLVIVGGLGGSLLVSYARARGESLGVTCNVGLMQRAERVILLGLSSIVDPAVSAALGRPGQGVLLLGVLVLIAAGSLATAVYRTIWIAQRLREGKSGRR